MGAGRGGESFFPNLPGQLIRRNNIKPTELQMAE